MLQKIHRIGEELLRKESEPVKEINDSIKNLVKDMFETMHEANGVGLAAPQIGQNIRLFVIDVDNNPLVFINPRIKKMTGKETAEEGCLSVPGLRECVQRATRVTAEAFDIDGHSFEIKAEGLAARAIQHELDHLDGVLFVDRISKSRKNQIRYKLEQLEAGKDLPEELDEVEEETQEEEVSQTA
ncbi:MAG: peptide deformylase [Candidatus Riflebacteria bacterium]|nr:peptide deformylase [Candidatus Riflebacteria bacterium]